MVSAATQTFLDERLAQHPRALFTLKDGKFGRLAEAVLGLARSTSNA
jgi:hypothetical protein